MLLLYCFINATKRQLFTENFLMGLNGRTKILHLVDFGLAANFIRNPHLKQDSSNNRWGLTGSPMYASRNAHRGELPCTSSRGAVPNLHHDVFPERILNPVGHGN
uniref:Protein kinase domain-containing protein n=1 Tax=Cacopsylla melanoneura TaxID=428564 RepID=A0A8D9BKP2_9HEMI